jgi:hypothetical protein
MTSKNNNNTSTWTVRDLINFEIAEAYRLREAGLNQIKAEKAMTKKEADKVIRKLLAK